MSNIEFVILHYPNDTKVKIEGDPEVISQIIRHLNGKFVTFEVSERFESTLPSIIGNIKPEDIKVVPLMPNTNVENAGCTQIETPLTDEKLIDILEPHYWNMGFKEGEETRNAVLKSVTYKLISRLIAARERALLDALEKEGAKLSWPEYSGDMFDDIIKKFRDSTKDKS